MAIHSSIVVWRIPWTEEPGGLQSVVSHRSDLACMHAHTHGCILQHCITILDVIPMGHCNFLNDFGGGSWRRQLAGVKAEEFHSFLSEDGWDCGQL